MNDSDNTLEILIQLRAKIDEAIAARNALDEVNGAQTAGAATAEDAAVATEKLNVSHRELHRLLHGLPPQFSQAGYAFTSLFYNPIFAGMLAITAIYQVSKKYLDDWNKALDAEGAAAAESATGGLENHRRVLEDIGQSMAKYRAELARDGVEADPLSAKIKDQNELYNLQVEAIKKVIEALGKQEEAAIRARGGSAADEAAARERTASRIADLDRTKGAHEIAALQAELDQRNLQQNVLERKVNHTAAAKRNADEALANAETERANLRKQLSPESIQSKAVTDAEKALADAQAPLNRAFLKQEDYLRGINAAEAKLTAAQQPQATAAARLKQLEAEDQARKDAAAAAGAAFEAAQAEAKKNQTRIGEIPREFSKEESRQATDTGSREISTATGLADKVLGGSKLDAAQQQFLMRMANLITGHANNLQQAAAAVHATEGNNDQMQTLLEKLVHIAESNDGKLSTLYARVSAIEHRK